MKLSSFKFDIAHAKSPVVHTCIAIAFSLGLAGSLHAADAPATSATAAMPSTNFTVAESIPIDLLIQKLYANSPLTNAVLRKALVEANPKVITGNPQQRVKGGTAIMVPDHSEIARQILTPIAAAAQEAQDNTPSARDYPVRKQWVRFP